MNQRSTRPSGTPLWVQIEATLRDEILQRRLCGKLPNEQILAERFQVNRHTVRQAVQALQGRGLVRVEHGRGTFVQEETIAYSLGKSSRFSHSLAKQQRAGQLEILSWSEVTPPADAAALLQLPADGKTLCVESLDLADARVVGVCTQYFPLPRFAGFIELYRSSASAAHAFAQAGIPQFTRIFSRISARLPLPAVAQALQQAKTQPVLYVESLYADAAGTPIEYGITCFGGDAVQIVVQPD